MTTMPPRPAHRRGDVVLVLFPHSDLSTAKLRPALVVQADNLQTGLPRVIVAMITSRLFWVNHPSRVTVNLSVTVFFARCDFRGIPDSIPRREVYDPAPRLLCCCRWPARQGFQALGVPESPRRHLIRDVSPAR